MKSIIFFLLVFLLIPISFNCDDYGTVDLQKELNLNFEVARPNNTPEYWSSYNQSYDIQLDDKIFYKGNKSLRLQYLNDNIDGLSKIYLPLYYIRGSDLKFTGYIKTENVENGYAGFRINIYDAKANNKELRMKEAGATGTNDWKEYSIETFISDSVRSVSIGVELTGSGTAWFDGLEMYIDGDKVEQEN
ncbi:MAG: hypothetical protein ISS16_03060 [Ignavibacteria bacterium]|nr:hypothetical protein [Ignavibacteria bacterium]